MESTNWIVHALVMGILANQKKALTRWIELPQNSIKGNWESSGETKHTKECHAQINWIHPRTIATIPNIFKRKLREDLDINRIKTLKETDKTFKVPNRDNGD